MKGRVSTRLIVAMIVMLLSLFLFVWTGAYFAFVLCILIAAMVITGYLYSRAAGKKLVARLMGSDEVPRGSNIPFKLEIDNGSRLPILGGRAFLKLKNDFTGEAAEDELEIGIGAGKKTVSDMAYESKYCGRIRAMADSIVVSDPLGFFPRERMKDIEGRAYVMPTQESLELDDDKLRAFDQESYKYSPYKKGDDPGEVFAIREYEAGDALRKIHWKLSGKLGELQIKESGFPEDNDIIVLLNRSLGDVGEDSDDIRQAIDKAGDLMASISKTLVERAVPHTMAWYNDSLREMEFYPISTSEDAVNAIKEMLSIGVDDKEDSTIIHYLSEREIPKTQHLYISEDEKDVDKLRGDGEVTIFRPTAFS